VKGSRIIESLKKKAPNAKFIFLVSRDPKIYKEVNGKPFDVLLESPIVAEKLVDVVASLQGLDPGVLFAKLGRATGKKGSDRVVVRGGLKKEEKIHVKGRVVDPFADKRKKASMETLKNLRMPSYPGGIPRGLVDDQVRDFRNLEESKEIKDIEVERREFVKALFRK